MRHSRYQYGIPKSNHPLFISAPRSRKHRVDVARVRLQKLEVVARIWKSRRNLNSEYRYTRAVFLVTSRLFAKGFGVVSGG